MSADVFTEPGDDTPSEVPAEQVAVPVETPEVPAETPKEAPPEKTYEEKYNELQVALRQERSSSRELKSEVEQMRSQMEQFKALREELENRRKERAEEEQRKLFEENPAEYLRLQTEKLNQKIEGLTLQEQEAVKKFESQQALENTVRVQASQFAQATPDYLEALKYVRDMKFAEYDLYQVPPAQKEAYFHQQSMEFAKMAVEGGHNAAELLYNLAKTWGYKGKPAQTAEEKVVQLQNGQKAAQTLSTGTAPPRESMLARVEEMSDEEFDKFWSQEISPKRRA